MNGNSELLAKKKADGETLLQHTNSVVDTIIDLIKHLSEWAVESDKLAEFKKLSIECAQFHDTGKAAIGFQEVLKGKSQNWGGKRHEIISAAFMSAFDNILPEQIFAVLTHHRDIPGDIVSNFYKTLPSEQLDETSPIFQEMLREWLANEENFRYFWNELCPQYNNPSKIRLSTEWLTRSGRNSQKRIPIPLRKRAAILRGLLITADHLSSAGVKPLETPKIKDYTINKYESRAFQKKTEATIGSAILSAPTGSGKTEAALMWAANNQCKNGRIFYVLPYTASINAMHERLSAIFGDEKVGVLHSKILSYLYEISLNDDERTSPENAQKTARELASLCKEAYHPIKVCTPHQILRLILRDRGWEQIFFEYPGACFIFDEIHAYDPLIIGLIIGMAKLLKSWNAKFLFVSATMTEFIQKLLIEHLGELPIIRPNPNEITDKEILNKVRHSVDFQENETLLGHIDWLMEECKKNKTNLIVCNHVKTAQDLYQKMIDKVNADEIKLLHSRFNKEDRTKIEKDVVSNGLPKILIATQVVEVSLDINFDRGFFEAAPIDALIQRMGRVNRTGKKDPAQITIFTKQVGQWHIYSKEKIKKTIDELKKLSILISEIALVKAGNNVYQDGYNKEEQEIFKNAVGNQDVINFEENMVVGSHRDWAEDVIEQTDKSIEVLPLELLQEYQKRKKEGLWLSANNLLVPIRAKSIYKYGRLLNLKNEPPTIGIKYDSKSGLTDELLDNILE